MKIARIEISKTGIQKSNVFSKFEFVNPESGFAVIPRVFFSLFFLSTGPPPIPQYTTQSRIGDRDEKRADDSNILDETNSTSLSLLFGNADENTRQIINIMKTTLKKNPRGCAGRTATPPPPTTATIVYFTGRRCSTTRLFEYFLCFFFDYFPFVAAAVGRRIVEKPVHLV